jgi:hypothetical protein
MSGERESLWGVQRRRGPSPAEDHGADDHASPKEQKLLDLQRTAGNAAVTGAVQRSMWGDMEDWFGGGGGGGGDNANLMTGGDQGYGKDPGGGAGAGVAGPWSGASEAESKDPGGGAS